MPDDQQNEDAEPAIIVADGADEKTTTENLPKELPLLPLRNVVLYPDMILPLVINSTRDTALVDAVLLQDRMLVMVPQRDPEAEDLKPEGLFPAGCAGTILKMLRFPDNTTRILVQGMARVRIAGVTQTDPFFKGTVERLEEVRKESVRLAALFRNAREQFQQLIGFIPQFPEEMKVASMNITDPARFADLVAANINLTMGDRSELLAEPSVAARLEKIGVHLGKELEVARLGNKIQADVQEKVNKGQRDFFLREQLKSIRKELGEDEDNQAELEEIRAELDAAKLPPEALKEAERELKRLESMQPGSAEYTVSRTYLDWMGALPWAKLTDDRLDVAQARRILDAEHFDLKKVKARIIEYLAVRTLNPESRGPILCFVGPPGVGKTSLGRSIAKALGREFIRISLGGVRDEAEIRGHRRTYVGALPGRIIQGLRKAGSRNPVFMMDEIDKLASDFRGDPASALLEVLDPEQNKDFSDHYLDVAFDLSKVMFITTANDLSTIPAALLDRMEVLNLPGYAEEEKIQIAKRHMLKDLVKENGLKPRDIEFTPQGLRAVVAEYTLEAGVRNLERELSSICRKVAVRKAEGKRTPVTVTRRKVVELLGPPRFHNETADRGRTPGIAVGLAWTSTGGDVLFIESTRMPGKGGLMLTGQLGDVMQESAKAALSWIRSHMEQFKLEPEVFEKSDFHIHFPEGAVPKDGPSAGITMITSLISLLTDRPIADKLAMTGELTLRGKVLPVGGIKEKMLAARRYGIRHVILPKQNENDLVELPEEVKKDLSFYPVDNIKDVLRIAFDLSLGKPSRKGAPRVKAKSR